jgi:hypothetical protein
MKIGHESLINPLPSVKKNHEIAFLFTGQGSQYSKKHWISVQAYWPYTSMVFELRGRRKFKW